MKGGVSQSQREVTTLEAARSVTARRTVALSGGGDEGAGKCHSQSPAMPLRLAEFCGNVM